MKNQKSGNSAKFGQQKPSRLTLLIPLGIVLVIILRARGSDPNFQDANWTAMGNSLPGTDGSVLAVALDSSTNLYIGGNFKVAGNVLANSVAKWDGTNWSTLGSGIQGTVYAIFPSSGALYAGGIFTNAGGVLVNNIAKWDGTNWSALGSGISSYPGILSGVFALTMSGSNLYAGGLFPTAGGNPATNIAKWNGSSWSALGSGIGQGSPFLVPSGVFALAVSGVDLYAGGEFTTAGGTAAARIARWNGTSWIGLGSGLEGGAGFVNALAFLGNDLYAGGGFTTAGGNPATNIAKWNGTQWAAVDSGNLGSVAALAASGGVLYAAARNPEEEAAPTRVSKWDGNSWSLAGELQNITAMALTGSDLYVGGEFTVAGNVGASHIAKLKGTNWSALGSGNALNGQVHALTLLNGEVYAGGDFTTVAGSAGNYVAKWTGSSWTALGLGIDAPIPGEPVWSPFGVYALAASGSNLFAGGHFTSAGGMAAPGIARWNGNSWSALGAGVAGTVYAMTVSGNDLYVGGDFGTAGAVTANGIAKWDGTNWYALGLGMSNSTVQVGTSVRALARYGNDLYAGGEFTMAGGNPAYYIARWDGTNWSAVGSTIPNFVSALAVSGDSIYAGGGFNSVFKWNGNAWTELFPGFDSSGTVSALAVWGNELYAGGSFTKAGGNPTSHIARWNGSNWSPLASGMNGEVDALFISGNDLYAGGLFTEAGGKPSLGVARAYLPSLPRLSVVRSGTNVVVSWPSVNTADFFLEQASQLANSIWTTNSGTVMDNGTTKSVTVPAASSLQLFRLRR